MKGGGHRAVDSCWGLGEVGVLVEHQIMESMHCLCVCVCACVCSVPAS